MDSNIFINLEEIQDNCSSSASQSLSPISSSSVTCNKPDLGRFNHWYLNKHFEFQKFTGTSTFTVRCLPCEPKQKFLSASKLSNANLKKHLSTFHASLFSSDRKPCSNDNHWNISSSSSSLLSTSTSLEREPSFKQPKISEFSSSSVVSQSQLNSLILNFIVKTMQPLRIVEEPTFIEMIKGAHNKHNVISRPTLTSMLQERFEEMQNNLRQKLESIEYVGTTADIWSVSRRSYMGMTIHWLDPLTLARHSAAISCARLKGTHNFEIIAKRIHDIHCAYNVQNKVYYINKF